MQGARSVGNRWPAGFRIENFTDLLPALINEAQWAPPETSLNAQYGTDSNREMFFMTFYF